VCQEPHALTTKIRSTSGEPLPYRIALYLHVSTILDGTYGSLDFAVIPRPILREILADLESRTGVASGLGIEHDALPDEGNDP
jgi:hypothetical protein